MKTPLKLSSIAQDHLQELYQAAGVARDELPYTPQFDELVQGFQDRTFMNAEPEQVFGAILKYVRTGAFPPGELQEGPLSDDQLKQLKAVLSRHLIGGKVLPYSDEFNSARTEFNKHIGSEVSEYDFWRAIIRAQGSKRRPPVRKKPVAAAKESDDDDE